MRGQFKIQTLKKKGDYKAPRKRKFPGCDITDISTMRSRKKREGYPSFNKTYI